jgi:hypothetical protein
MAAAAWCVEGSLGRRNFGAAVAVPEIPETRMNLDNQNEVGGRTALDAWTAFLRWLIPPQDKSGISKEEALEIGRQYYAAQGWRSAVELSVEESAYRDGDSIVKTFEVRGDTRGGDPQLHVRRSDGKVMGVVCAPNYLSEK